MKSFQITGKNSFELKDVPTPSISDDEVLVKMRASGICHSDYLLVSGEYVLPFDYPVTPGHEWSGEIVDVGSQVKGFQAGDRVTGECAYGCGHRYSSSQTPAKTVKSLKLISPSTFRSAGMLNGAVMPASEATCFCERARP